MIALLILAAVAYAAVGAYVGGRVSARWGVPSAGNLRPLAEPADVFLGAVFGLIWPLSVPIIAVTGHFHLITLPIRLLCKPFLKIADVGVRHQLRERKKKELPEFPEARVVEKKYCKVAYCMREEHHDTNHSVRP